MARHPQHEEMEAEMERLANILRGAWGWDAHGLVGYIKLTIPEAQEILQKMDELREAPKFKDATDELHYNLVRAQQHAYQAMDVCYRLDNPAKRNFWFRAALGRAQSILMTIYVRDLKKQKRSPSDSIR